MPLRQGHNKTGKYYVWGNSRTKHYYKSEAERKRAKQHAIIQAYAIEKSLARRGKASHLAKSKTTGRKTHLTGISSRRKSGSKTSRPTKSRPTKSRTRVPKTGRSRSKTSKTSKTSSSRRRR